ncbi:hypothetical protein ABG067_004281 [Albugo candida]
MGYQDFSVIMYADADGNDMRQSASVELVTMGGVKDSGYSDLDHEPKATMMEMPSGCAIKNQLLRECLAEFLGTFILLCFGNGVVAQVVLSQQNSGVYLSINMGWGLGVLFGIHCAGGVSGAHINPAVTTTLALFRRFPWRKAPFYILAQLLGAFCGAAMVLAIYYPIFNVIDPERETTHGLFATYPNAAISNASAFLSEAFGTALLMGGIFAIGDQRNKPAGPYTAPGATALLVIAIGASFGMNTGGAINPAGDLASRFLSAIGGWGFKTFTMQDYYFWVPTVGPIVGGAIGAGVYHLFVEMHHPILVNAHDIFMLFFNEMDAGRMQRRKVAISFTKSTKEIIECGFEIFRYVADSHDRDSLLKMVKSIKVVLTVVGHYTLYGTVLFQLCPETGTLLRLDRKIGLG